MYAIHAGFVISKTDGDRHYIGYEKLARLYQLHHSEWVPWDDRLGRVWDDYVHLYPDYEGNYGRPHD